MQTLTPTPAVDRLPASDPADHIDNPDNMVADMHVELEPSRGWKILYKYEHYRARVLAGDTEALELYRASVAKYGERCHVLRDDGSIVPFN